MNKKIFDEIIGNVGDMQRLVIHTKAIHGMGINGVDAQSFSNSKKTDFELVSSHESYVLIRFGYNGYIRQIYLPYETIDWIEEREYDASDL